MAKGEEVKTHYRMMMRLFHPDRTKVPTDKARDYAARINQALKSIEEPQPKKFIRTPHVTPPHLDLRSSQNKKYYPDGPMKKAVRHWLLNYSLIFFGVGIVLLLFAMFLWQKDHPVSRFEDRPVESPITKSDPTLKDIELEKSSQAQDEMPALELARLEDQPKKPASALAETKENSHPVSLPPLKKTPPLEKFAAAAPPKVNLAMDENKIPPKTQPEATSLNEEKAYQATPNPHQPEKIKETPPLVPLKQFSSQHMRSLTYAFVDCYNQGKIDALMLLISDDIKTDQVLNKAELRQAYEQIFNTTQKREMTLRNLEFDVKKEGVQAKMLYQVNLYEAGSQRPKVVKGILELEGRFDHDSAKITSLLNRALP
jgi:ketosteroid isomerase-like protein